MELVPLGGDEVGRSPAGIMEGLALVRLSPRLKLTIWNVAVHWTLVMRNIPVARCVERWFTGRSESAVRVLGCLKDGWADREDEGRLIEPPDRVSRAKRAVWSCET